MIKGTKEQVISELYKKYPAKFKGPGETVEYFFITELGTFETQVNKINGSGAVRFFRLNPKNSALSVEQEDIEVIL